MIQETKDRLQNIGKEQYFMNVLILIFTFISYRIAKVMSGNYYINFMITGIISASYIAYYKIYLINGISEYREKRVTLKMFINIMICNYVILILMSMISEFLSRYLHRNIVMTWGMFVIGYFILIILNMIIAPIEYTFFEKDYVFFEGIILGCKLLNKKKKVLILNNIKILGTHFLNIITIKLFTIKSSGLVYGINYMLAIEEVN